MSRHCSAREVMANMAPRRQIISIIAVVFNVIWGSWTFPNYARASVHCSSLCRCFEIDKTCVLVIAIFSQFFGTNLLGGLMIKCLLWMDVVVFRHRRRTWRTCAMPSTCWHRNAGRSSHSKSNTCYILWYKRTALDNRSAPTPWQRVSTEAKIKRMFVREKHIYFRISDIPVIEIPQNIIVKTNLRENNWILFKIAYESRRLPFLDSACFWYWGRHTHTFILAQGLTYL